MDRERGFMLLEVLVAGLALLVMSSCFVLYARSMDLRVADGCRVRAMFLARTQFAAAQADINGGGLQLGNYPWQGLAEDLEDGGIAYTVATNIVKAESGSEGQDLGLRRVSVEVKWQGKAATGELQVERDVVKHGKTGEE